MTSAFPVFNLAEQISMGVAFGIIAIINIIGNSCTIIAFIRDPKLRTPGNYFICNLAAADLIVGVCCIPFYATFTILGYRWPFGRAFCKVWNVVDCWVCAESAFTIILISFDRLLVVLKGAEYITFVTKLRPIVLIAISWLLSFLLYGPAIIGFDVWRESSIIEEGYCNVEFATTFLYVLVASLLEFLVPFIVVLSFSSVLYWKIRQRSRCFPKRLVTVAPMNASPSTQTHSHVVSIEASRRVVQQSGTKIVFRDRKVAKNLSILVVAFSICWAPYVMSSIIRAVCADCVDDKLFEFFSWLLWLNASINPAMYAYTNSAFAAHYKGMLCICCWSKQSHN